MRCRWARFTQVLGCCWLALVALCMMHACGVRLGLASCVGVYARWPASLRHGHSLHTRVRYANEVRVWARWTGHVLPFRLGLQSINTMWGRGTWSCMRL